MCNSKAAAAYENLQFIRWLSNGILCDARFQKQARCPCCLKFESSVAHLARCEVIKACLQEAFDGIREFFDYGNGWLSSCLLILSAHGASRGMRYEVTRAIATATKFIHEVSHEKPSSVKQSKALFKAGIKT